MRHATQFRANPHDPRREPLAARIRSAVAGVVRQQVAVIAGTDCGLGPRIGHPKIAWAKFEALVEGARLATRELWR